MAETISVVPRSTNWTTTATFTATSSASGFPASNAGTDDPSQKWRATSGTATLTSTLDASHPVTGIGIFSTNADNAAVISLAGGITGSPTLIAVRANDQTFDMIYIVDPPQTLSAVTASITGNSQPWEVGYMLVAQATTFPNYLDGFTPEPRRAQYRDRNDFGHTDIYDLGVEIWTLRGDLVLTWAQQRTLDALWRGTKAGLYPIVVIPDATQYPPFLVQMSMSLPRKHDNKHLRTSLIFEQVCPGLEAVA